MKNLPANLLPHLDFFRKHERGFKASEVVLYHCRILLCLNSKFDELKDFN